MAFISESNNPFMKIYFCELVCISGLFAEFMALKKNTLWSMVPTKFAIKFILPNA